MTETNCKISIGKKRAPTHHLIIFCFLLKLDPKKCLERRWVVSTENNATTKQKNKNFGVYCPKRWNLELQEFLLTTCFYLRQIWTTGQISFTRKMLFFILTFYVKHRKENNKLKHTEALLYRKIFSKTSGLIQKKLVLVERSWIRNSIGF
jgi:hypothetical protein